MNPSGRLYIFDNLKVLLIFLVVFGHMLEIITSRLGGMAYTFIYMFHMPLFVFCTGYFSKYNPKKILAKLVVPFLAFQFLYSVFGIFILGNYGIAIQFTTPFWMLWFLFSLIIWMLFLPIIDRFTNNKRQALITVSVSFVLGILAGFDDTMGYYMSLQRTFYFLPFFVSGFCMRKWVSAEVLLKVLGKWYVRAVFGILAVGILAFVFLFNDFIYIRWLWAAFSYERLAHAGYTFVVRIVLYLVAVVISAGVMCFTPREKLVVSYIGERTLQVFLLHGFIVLFLELIGIDFFFDGFAMLGFVLMVSLLIIFVLSSRLFSLSYWHWLFVKKGWREFL